MEEATPEIEAAFLSLMGKPISASTTEDADRFVDIMARRSQLERNRAASYTSATDIVLAAKQEMDSCGCPYDLPQSGNQLADARQIRVVHRPGCPLEHRVGHG